MSFWKNLFGGGGGGNSSGASAGPEVVGEESYKGHTIKAITMMNGLEYQLAGTIEKEIGGELKTYQFVRADRFASRDDMAGIALSKGRQIIDEQGDGIYR